MSVRKSTLALMLLLSLSATSVIAADVAGDFPGAAVAFPPAVRDLSNVRTAVADAEALVDKGDLAAARVRIKDLERSWDGAAAGSTRQTVAQWSVVDRAIDRGLDRVLLALRPRSPNAAMGGKALADLLAAVDQVNRNDRAPAHGGRP
jgi:hypothetical protein